MYNFPNNPTIGDIVNFPSSSQQYIWDGQAWTGAPMSAEFVTGSGGSSVSASHALFADNSLNAIYAQTASLALNFFTSSVTNATSASHALNADNALNAVTASFAITASYSIFNFITSSVTASLSSSYSDTASYVNITGSGILVNYNGSQIQLTGSAGGIIVSSSVPGLKEQGTLWFNSNDGNTYLQYISPSGNTWIPAATSVGQAFSSSYAATASLLLGPVTSASYAATASLLLGTVTSASLAQTASYINVPYGILYPAAQSTALLNNTWADVVGAGFTLPSAGTYEIEYNLCTSGNSNWNAAGIFTAANVYVIGSGVQVNIAGGGAPNPHMCGGVFVTITTATAYKLRVKTYNNNSVNILQSEPGASVSGGTNVRWKRIAQ